jgi:hypothetical protein
MIEDLVGHMGCNAQPGHPGHAGPAQIMEPPPAHSRDLIEQGFCSAEFLERLRSQQRKDEWSPLVYAFQYSECLIRKVHDMRLAILCS